MKDLKEYNIYHQASSVDNSFRIHSGFRIRIVKQPPSNSFQIRIKKPTPVCLFHPQDNQLHLWSGFSTQDFEPKTTPFVTRPLSSSSHWTALHWAALLRFAINCTHNCLLLYFVVFWILYFVIFCYCPVSYCFAKGVRDKTQSLIQTMAVNQCKSMHYYALYTVLHWITIHCTEHCSLRWL